MKVLCLFVSLVLLTFTTWSQKSNDFLQLVKVLDEQLLQYAKLHPHGPEHLPIDSFNLSKEERHLLLEEASYDNNLTAGKDSIDEFYMIFYYQDKITTSLQEVLEHPSFESYNLAELLKSNELSIVQSEDGKVFNFSLDEKMGGTYRSRLSIMHFSDLVKEEGKNLNSWEDFFAKDGYSGIYTLDTEQGVKYVLTGYVQGCSYCFETFVELISIRENEFHREFYFSTVNRDWENGVFYDPETNTISVAYVFDDLTSECPCDLNPFIEYTEGERALYSFKCDCKYIFKNGNFECIAGRLEKTYQENPDFPEIFSFTMAKSRKQAKLLKSPNGTLQYLYLDTANNVELSYPSMAVQPWAFNITQRKDTLSFRNGKTTYHIYEVEKKDRTRNLGIIVMDNGNRYTLKGDPGTATGSLKSIEKESFRNLVEGK